MKDLLDLQDEFKAHTYDITMWPRKWAEYEKDHGCDWQSIKLSREDDTDIPNASGVYSLVVQPSVACHPSCSYMMYVGKAASLRNRFRDYLNERKRRSGRPKIYRLLNKYYEYTWYCFLSLPGGDIDDIEDGLISAFVPPCNTQVPADISPARNAF